MTIPSDADQQHATPTVHLSRRAALEAERAAAKRTKRVATTTATKTTATATRTAKPTPARTAPTTRFTRTPRRTVVATTTATTTTARRRRTSRLTLTSAAAAVAMFAASAMPAHASVGTSSATSTLAPIVRTQDFAVTQAVATATTSRDGFTIGGGNQVVTTDPAAAVVYGGQVRSPFPAPVRMSSGFGYRSAPCAACSSQHQGLDFNPGMGAPIGAVAAGTVRVSGTYFSYGSAVIIDHVIDGRKVSTLYGHMIPGSSPVTVGQQVEAGEFIGSVGSSGVSTGAHLHLEVLMDGTLPVDPRAWIESHTGRAL
ncbi:M23 family metallopeptidase [Curtobacterium sp. VKM Ac-2922]|uniref:M23 family metallopeptidase n=1 Tax=Curtobacterium sp. VKM Ac-2922 TaxID=2929475 RepID=UPI001FB3EE4C|nr:M23 family metallopeptidase [Curtobacterium sp. VKM Ac-2922]MCJ1715266.1 M23 family metallopeptidase [Curtobacterium sp. VKM Ac-2922]